MADRAILQMDPTEPEDQVVSGHQQKRRDESGLGGDVPLPAARVHQIPDEIQKFPAGIKPGDPRNTVGSEGTNRHPDGQTGTNEKSRYGAHSGFPILTGQ